MVNRRFLFNHEMDFTTEIRNGNIENVKELLAHGANVEAHNDKGWSPLNIAIRNARFEIAKQPNILNVSNRRNYFIK